MAEKRIRATSAAVTPDLDAVKTPNETISETNKYDSILQMVQDLQEQNKILSKKVAAANNDVSEQVKESKRRYGYNVDGSRKADELFKYRYRVIMDDRVEKAVLETKTVGRPVNIRNDNTGKWTNQHIVEVFFHDGSKTEMDVLDYINMSDVREDFIEDSDKEVKDGKVFCTFHTEKFWTFTALQQ